jgi:hypothetical protein
MMLIVAGDPMAPTAPRHPGAFPVAEIRFDETVDRDFDTWPDGWRRQRGPGFPHFLKMQIADEPSPVGSSRFCIQLDGGAAAVHSPLVPLEPQYDYVLEGLVHTEGLVNDRAYLSLTLLDEDEIPIGRWTTDSLSGSADWAKLRLGPVGVGQLSARFAVIGLHVEPGARQDLTGRVHFDDMWLGRLSKLELQGPRRLNLYERADEIQLEGRVSGVEVEGCRLVLELRDTFDRVIGRQQQDLEIGTEPKLSPAESQADSSLPAGQLTCEPGRFVWQPPIATDGFYRVEARLESPSGILHSRQVNVVVAQPLPMADQGEFGWTLSSVPDSFDADDMAHLLAQVGINWVKLPVWNAALDAERLDRLVSLIDRLDSHGIQTIALLDQPPHDLRTTFGSESQLGAAILFLSEPDVWYSSLEPLLARLSLRVRWWQVGQDRDVNLLGFREVGTKLARVKKEMDRIGQDVNLAVPGSWMLPLPEAPPGTWRAVSLSADPPLAAEELQTYLDQVSIPGAQRWVVVEPLPVDQYDLTDRIRDLTEKLLVAKLRGADRIFLPAPFDPRAGLMTAEGQPAELLVPWRTMTWAMADAEYLGQLKLPGGTRNYLFRRRGELILMAWNDQPTTETLELGPNVRQLDLWGHELAASTQSPGTFTVDRLPTLLCGLDEAITRTRLATAVEPQLVRSEPGRFQPLRLSFKNCFARPIDGTLRMGIPKGWRLDPQQFTIDLAPGESTELQAELTLPYDAPVGKQAIQIECDLQSDRSHQFTIHEEIEVASGDVTFDLWPWLNRDGELEIHQQFTNYGLEPSNFRCELFAPNRRQLRAQIYRQGTGSKTITYRFQRGDELIGQPLLLRATEIDGPRVLNYRLVVQP